LLALIGNFGSMQFKEKHMQHEQEHLGGSGSH
jgi:hypothetical protein